MTVTLSAPSARCAEEMTAEVADGPGSALREQAVNRLPTAQALLHAIVTHGWER